MNESRVRGADLAARRRAFLAALGALVAGSAVIVAVESWGPEMALWIAEDASKSLARMRTVLLLGGVLFALPLFVFSRQVWVQGAKAINAREFPPPDQPVVRDTPVVTGDAAVRRGQFLRLLAVLLWPVFGLVWTMMWLVAHRLLAVV